MSSHLLRKRDGVLYVRSIFDDRAIVRDYLGCQTPTDVCNRLRAEWCLPTTMSTKEVKAILRCKTWTGTAWLDDPPPLYERIRQVREAVAMSKSEAAAEAGLDWRRWHEYETGQVEPSASKLAAIAKALGVTTDFLLDMPPPRVTIPVAQ